MAGTLTADTRKLEQYILTLPAAKQQNVLGYAEREAMIALTNTAAVVRGNIVGLPTIEDTAEQAQRLQESIDGLTMLHKHIMAASLHDLLGPADVAHLSALVEQIRERLQ